MSVDFATLLNQASRNVTKSSGKLSAAEQELERERARQHEKIRREKEEKARREEEARRRMEDERRKSVSRRVGEPDRGY